MKKVISIIFVLSLLCAFIVPASADNTKYVYDYIGNLTDSEISDLNDIATKIYDSYSFGVYFVKNNDSVTSDKTVEDGKSFYNQIGGAADGVMIYSTADYWYIHYSGKANDYFSQDDKQTLWNAFLDDETYYEGVVNYFNEVQSRLGGTNIVTTYGNSNQYVFLDGQHYDEQGIFITDDAGLLTSSELEKLNSKLKEINERQNFIAAIATTNTFNGKDVVAYSDDLFEERYSTTADGVILVINMTTRDRCISTGGFGETAINDYCNEYIWDRILSKLSDGDFYDAFNQYADICDEFVTQAKTGNPYDYDNEHKSPYNFPLGILGSLLTGGFSSLIGVSSMKSKLKSVAARNDAAGYSLRDSFNVVNQNDLFLYNTVSKTRRIEESSSRGGGGGGGSSTHYSSSGTSHGGSHGKF